MEDQVEPPWKVESVETLLQNPWFSVLRQQVRDPLSSLHEYFTVEFPRPAVGVIARRQHQYLLIHQYRFIVDEYVWAIPSGGVEIGELPEEAALRELHQETGHSADSMQHILSYYPSYGATNQRFELFLAEDIRATSSTFEASEVLDIGWFSREQIIEMMLANGIVDGLSLTPLAFLLLRETLTSPAL
jgi:ADP-ribose pyrophosphatase